jgi:protein-disulfide isomerase
MALIADLREAAGTQILLEPIRIDVAATGPMLGSAEAPVTIIEFSDFQCPYCKRVVPTVHEILKRYPDQVRIVFRHLPLRIHKRARAAAEASACADHQGKFWEYHDVMFENNRDLTGADLERYAEEVELDMDAFRKCAADRQFQQIVESDAQTALELGLSGAPAFFINGVPMRGARPLQDFVKLIDAELARRSTPQPAG